jgi:hypothetical protein
VIHEVSAIADALDVRLGDVEEELSIFIVPSGVAYLVGDDAGMVSLLEVMPPPFDLQHSLDHNAIGLIVFLQNDESNRSFGTTLGANGIPTRREHIHAIARGAAIHASSSLPYEPVTILPLSLNVVLHGTCSHSVIRRLSVLPRRADVILTTVHDNQRSVKIEVREGSRPRASDNLPFAHLLLDGFPPSPAGTLRIELSVVVDKSLRNIVIEPVEPVSGVRAKEVVERGVMLYENGVLEAYDAAEEEHREEDETLRTKLDWIVEGSKVCLSTSASFRDSD